VRADAFGVCWFERNLSASAQQKDMCFAVVAAAEKKISELLEGVAELRNLLVETQQRIHDEKKHKKRANLEQKRGEIQNALAHDEAQLQTLLKERPPRAVGRQFDTGTGLHACCMNVLDVRWICGGVLLRGPCSR
jgi:hypothetical protein